MLSKSQLAILLSRLKVFDKPELLKEQYPTDSEVAAELLWSAFMNEDIKNRVIADFGCGTGILGIGCLLLGAKRVYFVDSDRKVLGLLKKNLDFVEEKIGRKIKNNSVIINKEIKNFGEKTDAVVQNPPFGTKKRHADKEFLEKAMKTADVIYSFHKPQSVDFISKLAEENDFMVTHIYRFSFSLKKVFVFHKKRVQRIDVACWRLKRL